MLKPEQCTALGSVLSKCPQLQLLDLRGAGSVALQHLPILAHIQTAIFRNTDIENMPLEKLMALAHLFPQASQLIFKNAWGEIVTSKAIDFLQRNLPYYFSVTNSLYQLTQPRSQNGK